MSARTFIDALDAYLDAREAYNAAPNDQTLQPSRDLAVARLEVERELEVLTGTAPPVIAPALSADERDVVVEALRRSKTGFNGVSRKIAERIINRLEV